MCSCSTCSLVYPAPADICGGFLANQESKLSNRLPWGLLKKIFILYAMSPFPCVHLTFV
jgi:hypothetical protein